MRTTRAVRFDERDIEFRINKHNFSIELSATRQKREHGRITARDMGIGGDNAGLRDKESRTQATERFQANHGRLVRRTTSSRESSTWSVAGRAMVGPETEPVNGEATGSRSA